MSANSIANPAGETEVVMSRASDIDILQQKCPSPYYNLLRNVTTKLQELNIPFEKVEEALRTLLSKECSTLILACVNNIDLLWIRLHDKKICHEYDVDLLLKIFRVMQLDSLEKTVATYVDESIMTQMDVMKCLTHQEINPRDHHFLMITVHDTTRLTLKNAFEVKECISHVFDIQQHKFTLVGCQSGSIGLVWQLPDDTQSKFQEHSLCESLTSSNLKHQLSLIKLKTKNSEPMIVFSSLLERYDTLDSHNALAMAEQESLCDVGQALIGQGSSAFPTLSNEGAMVSASLCTQELQNPRIFTCPIQDASALVTEGTLSSYEHSEHDIQQPFAEVVPYPIQATESGDDTPLTPVFCCPCELSCSLTTYLDGRCSMRAFPYLQLSRIDKDCRENICQKLSAKTCEIIEDFANLTDYTIESLKARGVTPIVLAQRALQLKAFKSPQMLNPLMDDEKSKLSTSNTIDESFIILQGHMSFFNYEPLEHIIKGRQTGSEDDRRRMEDYSKKFELYCRQRLFRVPAADVGMCSTDSRGYERKAFVILVLEDNPINDLTHNDLIKEKRRIGTILDLESATLFLHKFDVGSLILVFSVPGFVYRELFPLSQQLASALRRNGYVLFTVPDTQTSDTQVESNDNRMEYQKTDKGVSTSGSTSHDILRNCFDELVSKTCNCLDSKVSEMQKCLDVSSIKECFTDLELTTLRQAESTGEIFDIFWKYWDYINYSLLKFIIDNCGSNELQMKMDVYLSQLHSLSLMKVVTKDNPPANFARVVTVLPEVSTTDYLYSTFEVYWQQLLEAWKLKGTALRIEEIDLEKETAILSLPRQYVPLILDVLIKLPQGITVMSIDGVAVEEYVTFFEDKPRFMLKAARSGLAEVVKTMLALDGGLIKERDEEEDTALMLAAKSGRVNTVEAITEAGAVVNDQNKEGKTPLMLAVICKHPSVVKYLLFQAKADPNWTKRPDGFTALKWAAQYGLIDIMGYLIKAGADVNENVMGWTALMSAAWHGTPEAVDILVENGAIVDIQDTEGMTALMWASRKDKQAHALKRLITAGANLNIQTNEGKTALMLAAECGCMKNVQYILETIDKSEIDDESARAAEEKIAVNLDIEDEKGETAILKAAIGGQSEIVKLLQKAGADDKQTRTAKNIQRTFVLKEEIQFGYSDICGTNIELSGEKYTIASRQEEHSSEDGITYSAVPLKGTSEFEVEVTNFDPYKGSMSIGVTRIAKGQRLKHELERISRGFVNSCVWNTGKIYNALKVSSKRIGHSYGLKDLSSLQKGSRIGLQLSLYDGSLGFLVDGCHQGFAAKGVYDDRFDVYAVVEHTGGCCGTRITRSVTREPDLQDLCLKMIVMSIKDEKEVESLPLPNNLKTKIITEAAFHEVL